MPRRLLDKGNIRKSDYYRSLLTDTQPGDIPIIISNDGYYKNLNSEIDDKHYCNIRDRIADSQKKYTIPYRYNIRKSKGGIRQLSLSHPTAQKKVSNFYETYGNLICYFCGISRTSIRSPSKIGSMYFFREKARVDRLFKKGPVDTIVKETATPNPSSYFSYRGFNRQHKFFDSIDYFRLEKRFSKMKLADISRCFSSIYTHTIYWAVADIDTAKSNSRSKTFANVFDGLMRSMNYNETNGICVGSEISRVFAEIILSRVDSDVIYVLNQNVDRPLYYRVDYEFRRYVDDYIIFANHDDDIEVISDVIESCLQKYNMSLNKEKSYLTGRPFNTRISRVIYVLDKNIKDIFSEITKVEIFDQKDVIVPRRISSSSSFVIRFVRSVKAICYDHNCTYDDVSGYIIGAINNRIDALIHGYQKKQGESDFDIDLYLECIMALLEILYFFYGVSPSVQGSLKAAQSAIQGAKFVKEFMPERKDFVEELIIKWTHDVLKGSSIVSVNQKNDGILLEALNAIVVLGEFDREDSAYKDLIISAVGDIKNLHYFGIVVVLYCFKYKACFRPEKKEIFRRCYDIIINGKGVHVDSESAHLFLDIISCPFLPKSWRYCLLKPVMLKQLNSIPSRLELKKIILEFEGRPWFVNWTEANILSMIRKKELSEVY